ncbi:MAG: hypothetical protein AAGA95_08320 [Pseudomonadota bacterium]
MDWVRESKKLFTAPKPVHFTDFRHCCECEEHDETLRGSSVDIIGLAELGNPGWDPLNFCTVEGLDYYFPALVRLSLDTVDTDAFYFEQLLFHLENGGRGNRLYLHASKRQRAFVASFLEHMITAFPSQLEANGCADDALRTYALWFNA